MLVQGFLNCLPFLFSLSEIRMLFKSFKNICTQANVGSTGWLMSNFINPYDGLLVVHGSLLKPAGLGASLRSSNQHTRKPALFPLLENDKGRSPTLEPHPIPLSSNQLYSAFANIFWPIKIVTRLSHRNHFMPLLLCQLYASTAFLNLGAAATLALDPTDDLKAVSLLTALASASLDFSASTACDPILAFTM